MKSVYVIVPVQKHLQGQHDQSSHGSWSGGAGQDITKEISEHLKNVFKKGDKEYKIFGYNISLELQKQITAMEKWDEAHGVGTMNQDYILRMVAERQGFTGKPKTVKADEFAKLRKQGYQVVFRGITDSYDEDGKLIATAEQIYEQFKTGNYYAGIGDFGDGTYVTNNPALATAYAKNDYDNGDGQGRGLVIAMLIPPDYVTLPKTKLSALTKTARKNTLLEIKDTTKVWAGSTDVGILATAQGVQFYTTKTPEGAGASTKCFNILDRSGLVVLDTPYWSSDSEVSKNDDNNLNKIVMESRKRAKQSKSVTGDKAVKLFDEIWQPLWDNLANVSKHLAGQHDQSSHGNWANGDGSNEISIEQLASIINANKPYDSLDVWRKTLQDVLKATGKTGKPTFGDTSQGMEFWRTFQQGSAFDLETSDNIRLSAEDKIKQFMASELPYISMGRNGIGLYGAHTQKEAEIWGYKGDEKQIVKMAFKPNAKILTIPSSEANWVLANSGLLESQINLLRHTALTDFPTSWFFTDKLTTRNFMALAMGYDAINDSPMLYDPADRSLPDREMVVLNAGALIVQNPDAVSKHLQGQHDQSTHGNWAGAEGFKSASLSDLPALDLSRLDSTTMDARNNYVGFGYSWMNDYLRSGNIDDTVRIIYNEQIPKEQGIAQIESLKNALYETETTQDLTVTRWSSGASLFRQQVSAMSEEDINGLVGKTFEAKGFTSTSAPNSVHQSVNDSFKASSTVFSNIHMPAGTHGATMGNDREGEFVIAPNTTFVVMGAKRLDKTRIVLDLLVTGQENG